MLHLLTILTCIYVLLVTQRISVSWRAETLHISYWDLCLYQLQCGHEQYLQSFSFVNFWADLGTNKIIYTINRGCAWKTHHAKPASVFTEHWRKATEGCLRFFFFFPCSGYHSLSNVEQARHLEIVLLKVVYKTGPIFLIIIICLTSSSEESYAAILWSSF